MDTAKLLVNERGQAVCLPEAYRFAGTEVYIKKTDEGVLLIPKENTVWETWEYNIKKYNDTFMEQREQPELQQQRKGLDEIFD